MKLYTIYYKIQAKHDEGKCQYYTHLNNYSRNFSDRQNQSACDRMTDRSSDNLEQTGIKNTKFEIWCPDLFKKKKKTYSTVFQF
jgi:hypothetical protein